MEGIDELIRSIVSKSQIPSVKRRHDILCELRSHLEDSILAAREAGRSDEEIQRVLLSSFGDPGQIAESFAWIYRRERAMMQIAVFLISTFAVAGMLAAAILAVQSVLALGFGSSALRVIASRHTVIEALDILSTVAVYIASVSIEKLFNGYRFQKSLAVVAIIFAIAYGVCAAANVSAPFLGFGLICGVFLRTIRFVMNSGLVRNGIAIAGFVAGGFVSFQIHPWASEYAVVINCLSWFVMGAGYQLMAGLAPRFSEFVSNGLQRV
jgi:hypothetical protein